MKLIAKLLPIIEYHICTSFEASKAYYRGLFNLKGGTGQGIKLSGNMYRDKSCFIIKPLENKELDCIVTAPISCKVS